MLANLAHLADPARAALVLCVVLGAIKRTLLVCRAAVDGGEAGRTDVKLGKLVKLNIDGVAGVALALRLGLPGLCRLVCIHQSHNPYRVCIHQSHPKQSKRTVSMIRPEPPLASIRLAKLRAEL